jgi:5-methylcytosine-specific restriction endonuclease McrA
MLESYCIFCEKFAENGTVLTNGSVYHSDCYINFKKISETLSDEISKLENEVKNFISEISKTHTIVYKIRKLLLGTSIDILTLKSKISENKKNIEFKIKARNKFLKKLESAWDFWPSYPPDWARRSSDQLDSDDGCEKCGSARNLHVHHRTRIADGGSHQADNLEVLCEKCHGKRHGRDFSGREFNNYSTPSAYSKRINIINEAIRNNKSIYFSYRKFEGERSVRKIDPEGLKQVGKSLCVYGWCHLRKENRIFAIRRMRRVKIV